MPVELRSPETDNPVSSFESGIIALNGRWIGVCLKLAMYDRSEKLMHWTPTTFRNLMSSLETYANTLGQNAFMLRADAQPELVADLPARHPYHTLLGEAPKISDDEVGRTSRSTSVSDAQFAIRGPTFEVRAVYSDGRKESIFFHEYTALSMYCYLDQYLAAAKVLSGPAAGSA